MMRSEVDRYLELRRMTGFKLESAARNLYAFAQAAEEQGRDFISQAEVVAWARETGGTQTTRYDRLRDVVHFARFLHVEDPRHEVPSLEHFRYRKRRPGPYIFTPDEVLRLIDCANHLRQAYPLCRAAFRTLIGLIAATGLRRSEALNLRFQDVLPEGALRIRNTKFRKARLVPLHPSTMEVLQRYLEERSRWTLDEDHIFVGATGRKLRGDRCQDVFSRLVLAANIAPGRPRRPRLHDLRHTFATRVLQQCAIRRDAVAKQFVALSTYLGHVDVASTYWYLEATPELMADISSAAEEWIARSRA